MFHKTGQILSRLIKQWSPNKPRPAADQNEPLSSSIQVNLNKISSVFANASDLVIRQLQIGTREQTEAFVVYLDGLVEKTIVNDNILEPLTLELRQAQANGGVSRKRVLALIKKQVLSVGQVKEATTVQAVIDAVLSGETVIVIDGSAVALVANTRGWETRGVQEPPTESVVRGPREGFTETLRTNTALLRRKIKNINLKLETMKIGKQTKTDVCIAYLKGIVNDKLVEEVKRRLAEIDTDSILESGYIEQFIEDAPYSFLPTVGNTEKPDIAAAKLLEGRIVILTDGTPFALTVPYLFMEAFQSSEDYYSRPFYSTIVRWIRFTAFFLSVFSPAIYVALTTFHPEMLPPALLISMAAAREGTPFPAIVEALGMGVIYEILREAGIRLPKPIGQAVSIVGALVIGESAVTAGLIGAPMVIVISITAIASFVVPAISDVTAVMRLILTVMAGIFGQYGIMMAVAGILTHMVSLRSLGVPYLSPLAPTNIPDLKDVLIRAPWWAMSTRPRVIGWHRPVRQKFHLKPEPPSDTNRDRT
ncbi:MAG: spore germination protein [Firmicutes bacterium]|nr:spore germination protein [Bacillota bacterium]